MPKNNKQECTEKIHKLIPEILELRFGCQIKDFFKGTGLIIGIEKYEDEPDCYHVAYFKIPVPNWELSPRNPNWSIIGRPIQLSDVLRAIDQNKKWPPIALSSSGLFLEKSKDDIRANAPYLSSCISYNLSLPFDQQSEEFYHFLNNIL